MRPVVGDLVVLKHPTRITTDIIGRVIEDDEAINYYRVAIKCLPQNGNKDKYVEKTVLRLASEIERLEDVSIEYLLTHDDPDFREIGRLKQKNYYEGEILPALGDKVDMRFNRQGKEREVRIIGVVIGFHLDASIMIVTEGGGMMTTAACNFRFIEKCTKEELLTHSDDRVRNLAFHEGI